MHSSNNILLQAENLRKVYRLHEHQATTLKEMVVKNVFARSKMRDHVALDELTLALGRGVSLGVIGPNGSGKSTLLKLAAGIIAPTGGTIRTRGRIASLLELGAGFQPEFTGMENIFLQGRIQGLTRPQILERLDAILDFSGLGSFIHTPIKRYSTGMTVRLGFAIAVHFDADLLLVDEVLSVGDGAFQAQCLERINHLRSEGKTFLFVSHDLNQVESVADRILWLERGKTRKLGPADEVLQAFEREMQGHFLAAGPSGAMDTLSATLMDTARQGTGEVLIRGVEVLRKDGRPARRFPVGEPVVLAFDLEVVHPLPKIELWLALGNTEGQAVAMSNSGQTTDPRFPPFLARNLGRGRHRVVAELDPPCLSPGHYLVSCSVNRAGEKWHFLDIHLRLYRFTVEARKEEEAGEAGEARPRTTPNPLLLPPARWEP